jgi:hypothetical protein
MKTRAAVVWVALLAAPLFAACTRDAANDGDCNARILYQGVMYRWHQELNQAAPAGSSLGQGDVVDCGDVESAPKVDEVTVRSIRGVAASVAVKIVEGEWRGVYVSEDAPPSDWPQVLRRDSSQP